jgi:hypothetical protein
LGPGATHGDDIAKEACEARYVVVEQYGLTTPERVREHQCRIPCGRNRKVLRPNTMAVTIPNAGGENALCRPDASMSAKTTCEIFAGVIRCSVWPMKYNMNFGFGKDWLLPQFSH